MLPAHPSPAARPGDCGTASRGDICDAETIWSTKFDLYHYRSLFLFSKNSRKPVCLFCTLQFGTTSLKNGGAIWHLTRNLTVILRPSHGRKTKLIHILIALRLYTFNNVFMAVMFSFCPYKIHSGPLKFSIFKKKFNIQPNEFCRCSCQLPCSFLLVLIVLQHVVCISTV